MVDGTDIVADENSNDEDLCKEKADKEMTDSPTHNKPVDDVCFNSSNMLDSTGNGTHNGSPQPQEVISPNSEDLGHPLSFSKAAVRRTAKEAITTQNETQNTTSTDNATGTDNTTGTDTTATQRLSADYVETLSRCTGVFLLYLAGALQETSQRSTRFDVCTGMHTCKCYRLVVFVWKNIQQTATLCSRTKQPPLTKHCLHIHVAASLVQ
eukprot:Lankesteria_metandrocarpae@DN4808_c0_g1_i2.p1